MSLVRTLAAAVALCVPLCVSASLPASAVSPDTTPDTTPGTSRTTTGTTSVHPVASRVPDGFFWQLTSPQEVLPGAVLTPVEGAARRSHGTRSDRQFFAISSTGDDGVPEAALRAYRHAAQVTARTDPSCHLSWTLLAAIGRVESDHGRYGGARLGSDGVSLPAIRGPRLDGTGAFAAIADTDHGRLDHDAAWDRAVGQMQFLPATWASVGRDGDGDGRRDPDDVDDSALGAAVYLCGAGGDLADPAGAARAIFRYNHSDYYVALVRSFQVGYTTGVFTQPSPPPPAEAPTRRTPTRAAAPTTSDEAAGTAGPTPAKGRPDAVTKPRPTRPGTAHAPTHPQTHPPAHPPAHPRPTPAPVPVPSAPPTPTTPRLVTTAGTWTACAAGFCLDGTPLDVGTATQRAARATADLDGDRTVESVQDELTGLVGHQVSLQVAQGPAGPAGTVVYVVDGHGLRNADGSFATA